MKKLILTSAMIGAFVFANSAFAALIDNFTVDQGVIKGGANGATSVAANSSSTVYTDGTFGNFISPFGSLGSSSNFSDRTITVTKTGNVAGGTISGVSTAGSFSVNTDNNIVGNVKISWTTGTSVDFTGAGAFDRFKLGILTNDASTATLNITATDTSNQTKTSTVLLTGPGTSLFVLFSSLTGTGNLSAVKKLDFQFNITTASNDLSFNVFNTTNAPEPATISLMGIALAGFAATSRKKA